uniref:Small EDRK-rich factor-like N-terminal domain-containing protein n=1 Tax=Neogobius melanostomus TaxID=47308 RepID=A0A8C6V270_9GOBI
MTSGGNQRELARQKAAKKSTEQTKGKRNEDGLSAAARKQSNSPRCHQVEHLLVFYAPYREASATTLKSVWNQVGHITGPRTQRAASDHQLDGGDGVTLAFCLKYFIIIFSKV